MQPVLNIVGAGKVGRVLGQLLHRHDVWTVQDVCTRSAASAAGACAFIGAGTPQHQLGALRPADLIMLAVPDDQIPACHAALDHAQKITADTIVFHCSGALSSDLLRTQRHNHVASLHPVRSFAEPASVAAQFAGTICTLEGHATACQVIDPALRKIGAQVVSISAASKPLYHASAVFAANYLVTLMDTALRTMEAAGVDAAMARAMLQPLAQEAFNNTFRLGARDALTGPIARGDMATVARHQAALQKWDPDHAALYHALAVATTRLAAQTPTK